MGRQEKGKGRTGEGGGEEGGGGPGRGAKGGRNAAGDGLWVTWRVALIQDWPGSCTRRDSAIARAADVHATPAVAGRLSFRSRGGHHVWWHRTPTLDGLLREQLSMFATIATRLRDVNRACVVGMFPSRLRGAEDSSQTALGAEVWLGLVAERLAVQGRGRSHHDAGQPKKI